MFDEKTLSTPNGEFAIIDEGTGTPVLLLHGFPDSKELWKNQIPALVNAGFRVIAPDLRGFGNSIRPIESEQYAMPLLVGDMIGVLDALNLEKVHLVGHDWGAALAWALAQTFEHRFHTFTTLSVGSLTNAAWATVEQKQKSWYIYLFLQVGLAEMTLCSYNWDFMKKFLGKHPEIEQVIEQLEQKDNGLTTGLNWYRANFQHLLAQPGVDYTPTNEPPETPAEKISIPVLGVWSTLDDYLGEEQVKLSTDLSSNFTYKKLEGAGHWMMLDKPNKLNTILLNFLNKDH
jgi:pimeloyl-ACP methyl ester carboxylesterase